MEVNIQWLYEEYHKLMKQFAVTKDRIEKVAAAITAYGGTVPNVDEIQSNALDVAVVINNSQEQLYPYNGTWKEKILHTIKRYGRPVIAAEISTYIVTMERQKNPKIMPSNINNTINTTLSRMGADDDLVVDTSQYRNKYSIPET